MTLECGTCAKEFQSRQDYDRHMNRKRPCGQGGFPCDGCGQKYKTQKTLDVHKKDFCKGKNNALLARELAAEVQQLRTQMGMQGDLFQMANSATAAAANGISMTCNHNGASGSSTQNNTQNNVVINIHQLHPTNNIGEEKLKYITDLNKAEARQKLNLSHTPAAMAAWCAMVRADDEHPENHNALLLGQDSKLMACSREGIWAMEEREDILLQIIREDLLRFYRHLSRFEGDDAATSFRNEYLLHHLMQLSNSGDKHALKSVLDAIAKPIIDLTLRNYAVPKEEHMSEEQKKIDAQLQVLQLAFEQDQVHHREKEARNMAILLDLRRTLINTSGQAS